MKRETKQQAKQNDIYTPIERQTDRQASREPDTKTDHCIAVVTTEDNDVNRRRVIGYTDSSTPRSVLSTCYAQKTHTSACTRPRKKCVCLTRASF